MRPGRRTTLADEGCPLIHVLHLSKELNFYRAILNGLCVSAHMVDSFFTEHVAVMSPLWLDVRAQCRCGAHVLCGGTKSFTMTCGTAASGSMAVFFHDVAKNLCEEVHAVTGTLSGSDT